MIKTEAEIDKTGPKTKDRKLKIFNYDYSIKIWCQFIIYLLYRIP